MDREVIINIIRRNENWNIVEDTEQFTCIVREEDTFNAVIRINGMVTLRGIRRILITDNIINIDNTGRLDDVEIQVQFIHNIEFI